MFSEHVNASSYFLHQTCVIFLDLWGYNIIVYSEGSRVTGKKSAVEVNTFPFEA